MKENLLIMLILLIPLSLPGQPGNESLPSILNKETHSFGDITVSLSPDLLYPSPRGLVPAGGIKLRVFMGKRFSFDSDLLIGRNFLQIAPGIFGIPMFLFSGEKEDDQTIQEFLISILVIALSAEHFSYHIPVKDFEISPYISLLRYRQFTNVRNTAGSDQVPVKTDQSSLCFSAGIEVNRYFKRFLLSPYIDYTLGYSHSIHGFTIGLNCGYYFPKRK